MRQSLNRFLILLGMCSVPTLGVSLECASSQCYLNAYDRAKSSSLPELQNVVGIYEKMARTIGSKRAMRSKLLIIESESSPWAVALSDNTIVITSGTIKSMYHNSDNALGDARAAFILGHELSHLETEDLFHHRAFLANFSANKGQQLEQSFLQQRPDEEVRADLKGFTYATVAGFDTGRLFSEDSDFFLNWLPISNSATNKTHPDNAARRQFLAEGFKNILRDIPYYRYATVLAHFGHYEKARHLFEDFLNHVETEEAFSNLGYVHLQLAREAMPISLAYKYWIPTVLEPASGLSISRERGLFDQELPTAALQHLKKAEQYLKQAINMDSAHLVSHVNLAAVYLYMPDKIHLAFAAIEEAKRTKLGAVPSIQMQLDSIDQIIRLEINQDDVEGWAKARRTLEQYASNPLTADNLLYNFARLLDDRGLDNTAVDYWERLYERLDFLPRTYQDQVCFRLPKNSCKPKTHEQFPLPTMDAHLSRDIRYPEVRQYLNQEWNTNSPSPKALPDLSAKIYLNQQGDSLLALDNQVEMMIIKNVPQEYNELAKLQAQFGSPIVALPLNDGQILSYGGHWAALIKNGKVTEIWISGL